MLKRMTTIVIGPNDKISGTCVVSAPSSAPDEVTDQVVQDADDQPEEENA